MLNQDINIWLTCLRAFKFLQWKIWFVEGVKTKLNSLDHSKRMVAGVLLSYEPLIGEENFSETNRQNYPSVLALIRELALKTWEKN